MKAPQKIADAIQRLSAERQGDQITSAEAVVSLREVIEQDPVYCRGILAGHAERLLAAWSRTHPAVRDPLQAELFPGLPAVLYVSPGHAEPVMNLTRWGVECAKNMLLTRLENQLRGATEAADRERAEFMAFYEAVVPLMTTRQTTVADALARRAEAM
ncbi:MAG: hypothetical protein ACR2MP_02520 [Streptosporangiaceae bacterium]